MKLLFEYGLIASIFLLAYVFMAICYGTQHPTFALAIVFTLLFLGGYLLNGIMAFLFVALAAWHNDMSSVPAVRRQLAFVWR